MYPVPLKEEPPDYFLTIDGKIRYAVEVTGVVDQINLGRKSFSSEDISASFASFTQEIEDQAITENLLNGSYIIDYFPFEDFPKYRENIKKQCLDYVRETQDLIRAGEEIVLQEGPNKLIIRKLNSYKDFIIEGISFPPKSEDKIIEDLRKILKKTLQEKISKLKKVSEPIILLLLDDFHYADEGHWQNIIGNMEINQKIHTIVRVYQDLSSKILYTKEPLWIQKKS